MVLESQGNQRCPMKRICDEVLLFVRWDECGDEPDAIEREFASRFLDRDNVSQMRRIEGPSHQSYSHREKIQALQSGVQSYRRFNALFRTPWKHPIRIELSFLKNVYII